MCNNHLVFVFVLILSFECVQLTYTEDQDKDWKLLIFTQNWPPTVCKIWKENPSHECNLPKNEDTWTVHGIWPTSVHEFPQYCNKTWIFDPELIKPIEDELNENWPSIEYSAKSLYSFWAHEWSKHGTCAAILDDFNSEFKYFKKGIDWLEKYSMNSVLEAVDIVPSNDKEYAVTDISNAVKTKFGVNPIVECRYDQHEQYLLEIRICITKNLELTDCDQITNFPQANKEVLGNCNVSKGVKYPQNENTSRKTIIQLYKLINWLQWLTL